MANIDKLALVTKVLMDRRFLELKEENEFLKLKMFWHTHNIKKLNKAMIEGNLYVSQCKCENCCYQGRAGHILKTETEDRVCGFKPWFEEMIIGCGLTIGDCSGQPIYAGLPHMDDVVYDNDYHILNEYHGHCPIWSGTAYGGKLWKAKSVSDPELKKIAALFIAIRDAVYLAETAHVKQWLLDRRAA